VSLSALLAFLTVQCVLLGILSELLIRIYHDIRGRPIYRLRRLYGDQQGAPPAASPSGVRTRSTSIRG